VNAMQECGASADHRDHGNAEQMIDHTTHQAHTGIPDLVPFLYIGRNAGMIDGGALRDVAPPARHDGLPQPPEMTGKRSSPQ